MSSFKDAIARLGHTEEGELLDERREDVRNTYDSLVNERNADGGLKYENLRQYTSPVKPMERPLVGREKEMEQVLAAMMRPELCNVILLADAGTGKAHANGTMVPVCDERGYVKIEDLKPGDKVFDENGKPIDVLQIFPQGKKRAFRVTFDDGSTNVCNDEHIWHVQSRYSHYMRYNDYQNLTLREILDKGLKKTCIRKDTGRVYETSKWFAPVNHAVERPEYDFPVHPYVVGVLLGDGSLSSPTSGRLIVSTNDEFVVKKVATLIGSEEVVQSKSTYDWYFKRPDVKFYNNKPVYYLMQNEILSDVCFVDTMAHVKSVSRRIPEIYFLGSIEQRRELLQGLMDTDGCVTGDYKLLCKFSTHSEGLAKDVQRLAASLGYRTSFKSFERCKYGVQQISYEIYFRIPLNERENLFTLPRQLEKIASCKDAYDRKYHRIYEDIAIVDVEDLGYSVDMTCIYVNNPNHLYQVGYEHLVTHNTALVQGLMKQDIERLYLEVDLSKMIADVSDNTQLGDKLKQLFAEVQSFHEANDLEIVLFMDEFHQIVQLSHAAVEALKPLLADSGTRGIRVIAATTFIEFRDFVQPNQPLVERLQRINLDAPDKKTVVQILKGMAKRYGVDNQFPSDAMFEMIYEMTNRYIPANSQPRKSILILDTMVGWYRYKKRKMNMRLLADVIYETEGVNIAFRVDATKIKEELDKYVFAQQFATSVIEERLQVCVADLNNKNKPMASMLFSGPTGVGKLIANYETVPVFTDDGAVVQKPHGDLKVGDKVFDRLGHPTEILDVFPHKDVDMYRVILSDGRTLDVGDNHLWTVCTSKQFVKHKKGKVIQPKVMTTKELLQAGIVSEYGDGRRHLKWFIPRNGAVQWKEQAVSVHPYVMGALIGNGCLTLPVLGFSSNDMETVEKLTNLIGATGYAKKSQSYTWHFELPEELRTGNLKYFQTDMLLPDYPEVCVTSREKRIPHAFMYGSVEQRWQLIQGLFDTDGTVSSDDRVRVSFSTFSEGLALDVQSVLFSLGVSSTIRLHTRYRTDENGVVRDLPEYIVRVKSEDDLKYRFFSLSRKLEVLYKHMRNDKQRKKDFSWIGISDIQYIGKQDAQCIYVDNEEHLYQAGPYVVTHNTEISKQLARILFDDEHRLIRFDMTEYANPDSLDSFRNELTNKVWARPFSIILLDEIEKACAPVTRLLLQVLDDGRLMDENNREVVFTNAYIIMTTNAGSEVYRDIAQYDASDTGDGQHLYKYEKLIRKSISGTTGDNRFPPELLGRIDCIVPFQPLSEKTQMNIVASKLEKLIDDVRKKHGVELQIKAEVVEYICRDRISTDSDAGGARAAISKMESEVFTAVARHINAHPDDIALLVDVAGQIAWKDKYVLDSEAYIVVKPIKQNVVQYY